MSRKAMPATKKLTPASQHLGSSLEETITDSFSANSSTLPIQLATDFEKYFPKSFKAKGKNWNQMVSFQVVEDDRKTTDVHLTCTDGFVPAHAFILCSMSPFIKDIFFKQGEDYPGVRLVILPDFKVAQVSKVVQLMYSGTTEITGPDEARQIGEILKTLQINLENLECLNGNDAKCYLLQDEVIHYLFTPEAIKKQEEDMNDYGPSLGEVTVPVVDDVSIPSVSSNQSEVAPTSPVPAHNKNQQEGFSDESHSQATPRKARRALRPRINLTKKKSEEKTDNTDSEESDEKNSGSVDFSEEAKSGIDSSESEASVHITKRITRNAKPKPSVRARVPGKATYTNIVNSDDDSPAELDNSSELSNSNSQERKRPSPTSDTSSDSEFDKDEDKRSVYNNQELFEEQAKICGKCKKKYKSAKEASDCITEKHGLVRCYFCFDVCTNTDKLFVHYGEKHQKTGRENTVLCPFCQGTVPYKSVSTHVISNHLFATKQVNAGSSAVVGVGRGRLPNNTDLRKYENRPGPKRMKIAFGNQSQKGNQPQNDTSESDEDDHIQTSNTLIKKKSANGVMKTFLLRKEK